MIIKIIKKLKRKKAVRFVLANRSRIFPYHPLTSLKRILNKGKLGKVTRFVRENKRYFILPVALLTIFVGWAILRNPKEIEANDRQCRYCKYC